MVQLQHFQINMDMLVHNHIYSMTHFITILCMEMKIWKVMKVPFKTLKDFNIFKNESEYNFERLVNNKSLSSGQMQKIGFARIMVSKPDIILLDESTSNLDKESKEIVFKKLKENQFYSY